MAQSVLDRLKNSGYIALSAEIDPEAAAEASAAEPVTDEVAAERVAIAEEAVADADIAIEIRGDLDEAESIVIEIRKDDEIGESLAGASEELTETVLTTESYMKEGGMTAQTAQEHLRNLKRLGAMVGFKINPALPSFESFGGISSRLDATGLVMQEEQNWLKKVWETIKGWLKTAYDNVMKFFERIFTAAGRLEARAQGIADNILKRKQHAKAESVKASAATVKLIGSGDIKGAAAGVRETYQKAFAASLERAMRFNGAVVASLKPVVKRKLLHRLSPTYPTLAGSSNPKVTKSPGNTKAKRKKQISKLLLVKTSKLLLWKSLPWLSPSKARKKTAVRTLRLTKTLLLRVKHSLPKLSLRVVLPVLTVKQQ